MANVSFLREVSIEKLLELGFVQYDDGSGDARGITWDYDAPTSRIHVDAYWDISLSKKGFDGENVKVQIECLTDLEDLIQFVDHEAQ